MHVQCTYMYIHLDGVDRLYWRVQVTATRPLHDRAAIPYILYLYVCVHTYRHTYTYAMLVK